MTEALPFFSVLAIGLVLGFFARVLVPGGEEVTWSETIVAGIAGAGLVGLGANLIEDPGEPFRFGIWTVLAAVAGSTLVLGGLIVFKRRANPQAADSTAELIDQGESDKVEFKQTARHNSHTGKRDPKLELVIAKTVAGFMNAEGGTLLIGVADDGSAVGIADDLSHMKQPDLDRYELWLTDLLETSLGTPAVTDVAVSFDEIEGNTVVRVDVAAGARPVFVDPPGGGRDSDFYVRTGNSTRKLRTDEVLEYEKTRWK